MGEFIFFPELRLREVTETDPYLKPETGNEFCVCLNQCVWASELGDLSSEAGEKARRISADDRAKIKRPDGLQLIL